MPLAVDADGVCLLARYRNDSEDPNSDRSRYLSRICYGIQTVFGHLVECYLGTRVPARDLWHIFRQCLDQSGTGRTA